MLQHIRDRAQGWFAYAIVILISIPFALWGIQEYVGGGTDPVVAKVGKVEITQRSMESSLNNYRANLRQQFGGKIPEFFNDDMLRQQVLNEMIQEALLTQQVDNLNIRAGDEMVRQQIRSMQVFQRDGVFDKDEYERVMRSQGRNINAFTENLRMSLGTELLTGAISTSAFVTDAEIDALIRRKNQQRVVSWLLIDADSYKDQIEFGDSDIETYYNENKQKFRRPERVKLEYVELNHAALSADISVDVEALRASYEERKDEFKSPETRTTRHILIKVGGDVSDDDAKAEALKLLDEIKAGADFAELAREHSDDKGSGSNGGDLGVVERGMMVKPFEDEAFALQQDQISELVRSRFGYHIIQVTKIEGGDLQSFDDVKQQLADEFKKREADELFGEKYDQLAELSYADSGTLQTVADAIGVKVQESDWVPRTGASGKFANAKIIQAAFGDDVLNSGRNSDVLELEDDNYMVVRVANHEEETAKPLDDVSAGIRSILEKEQTIELTQKRADQVLNKLTHEGGTMGDIAADESLKLVQDKTVKRTGNQEIDPQIVSKAFAFSRPAEGKSSYGKVELANGSVAVIGVSSAIDGDPAALTAQERDSERQGMEAVRGQGSLAGYIKQLRADSSVKIMKN
ncbi:MAG: SurA N-terminal domain-containing protein [Gammaproteobacteria bacterium]|nr:SurA N-terminal domain-containing protein [Gammaproteobacteria bacterium]